MAKQSFEFTASLRTETGTGASKKLRNNAQVPVVIYGANKPTVTASLFHKEVLKALENEAVFSHILDLKLDNAVEKVVLKDLQRHPFKPRILHMDFLRISAHEKLTINIPLHFLGEDKCPGVKDGGVISHLMTELEIKCLPADLPEFIEIEVQNLQLGEAVHLSQVTLPKGVELAHPPEDELHDQPVVSIHLPRKAAEDIAAEEAEAAEAAASASETEASEQTQAGENQEKE